MVGGKQGSRDPGGAGWRRRMEDGMEDQWRAEARARKTAEVGSQKITYKDKSHQHIHLVVVLAKLGGHYTDFVCMAVACVPS